MRWYGVTVKPNVPHCDVHAGKMDLNVQWHVEIVMAYAKTHQMKLLNLNKFT